MGLLASMSAVRPVRGMTTAEYDKAFWGGDAVPEPWLGARFGGTVSPEVALTLTYVYSACSIISDDFGTMTCQGFANLGEDQKERIKYSEPGIGSLARKLRWQPNSWQTAKAFWSTMAWQYLLRPMAFAEIVYRPGLDGFVDQIVPRHPDRVRQERLPNSRLRYRLLGEPGGDRFLTQDEVFVVRNTSTDGLNAIGRIDYGGRALATGLALQDYTHNYFKKGATAALLASYKGDQDDELEDDLHASITRYMSGAENAGGVLLVPSDIDVKALGVDPDKSQLLGLKGLSGRDVARLYKMPPSWLGIEGANAYTSQVQDATNYVNRCQVPMAVEFEQTIQRDLVLAVDRFYFKFNMDYLLRADFKTRMEGYEIGIRSRVLRPSECRVREDLNPDAALDRLSEQDNRPGTPRQAGSGSTRDAEQQSAKADRRQWLETAASAVACVRRERAIVVKLATKHASDIPGWKAALQDFYKEHAQFVAKQMRMPADAALAYAAQHGAQFETQGIAGLDGDAGEDWQRHEAAELADLALTAAEAA